MKEIRGYLNVNERFNRSIRLERDFFDPLAVGAYVITEEASAQVNRLFEGLDPRSGQRAWRITGDYGSGKSSFALLLAHLFKGDDKSLSSSLWAKLDQKKISTYKRGYLNVLITGSRNPIRTEIAKALVDALVEPVFFGGEVPKKADELSKYVSEQLGSGFSDRDLVDTIKHVNNQLIELGLFNGMLIVIDELGKFLEFAADNPEEQDIFFLQDLAETASRSRSKPVFVIGILHQGLTSYAKSEGPQKELEKVAGRYEEIVFRNSIAQVATLTAEALSGKERKIPDEYSEFQRKAMSRAIEHSIFGSSAPKEYFKEISAQIYPLHPSVLLVMNSFFSRFGQNERSLFSFFVSQESFALNDFAGREATKKTLYRISDFYDYMSTNFGHLLGAGSFSTHWNQIESLVRSFRSENEIETLVVKTIAVLDFMSLKELRAFEEIVCLSLDQFSKKEVIKTLALLQGKGVLFSRGKGSGYRLWDHSSVDLAAAFEHALSFSQSGGSLAKRLKEFGLLSERPLVARRHFIETGNLRYFEVIYTGVEDLETHLSNSLNSSDGRLLIPICETKEELNRAVEIAESQETNDVIGISSRPLQEIDQLIKNCSAWQWIAENEGGLKDDRFAAEEVSRALTSARRDLQIAFQSSLGLVQKDKSESRHIDWYRGGKIEISGAGRNLHSYLSNLCDKFFPQAPKIINELVNRTKISAAAKSASNRLIKHLFENADQNLLGLPSETAPPEKSMYLSTLYAGKVHVKIDESQYKLVIPEPGKDSDPCNLNPSFMRLLELLESKPDQKIRVDKLFEELKKPPYGMRDGLFPIILTVLLICRKNQLALYYDGTFESEIDHNLLLVLAKKPEIFELQSCKIEGLRIDLLERIYGILKKGSNHQPKDLLEVVKPLCQAIAGLSEYVRKTDHLSTTAIKVRDKILNATDPGKLLFEHLPTALDLPSLEDSSNSSPDSPLIPQFTEKLEHSLEELRHALNKLRERLISKLFTALEKNPSLDNLSSNRRVLTEQAEEIAFSTSNIDLKAFCLRMADSTKSDFEWIDSIASLLANSPPDKWLNQHEEKFEDRLGELVGRFIRAEQLNFANKNGSKDFTKVDPVRISLTKKDGSEKGRVLHLNKTETKKAEELAKAIKQNLPENPSVSLKALYDVFWEMLPEDHNE